MIAEAQYHGIGTKTGASMPCDSHLQEVGPIYVLAQRVPYITGQHLRQVQAILSPESPQASYGGLWSLVVHASSLVVDKVGYGQARQKSAHQSAGVKI